MTKKKKVKPSLLTDYIKAQAISQLQMEKELFMVYGHNGKERYINEQTIIYMHKGHTEKEARTLAKIDWELLHGTKKQPWEV